LSKISGEHPRPAFAIKVNNGRRLVSANGKQSAWKVNMLESTSDNDDLTPAQEYAIAGGVILLFGLLYWFLNNSGDSLAALQTAQVPAHQTVMLAQGKVAVATDRNEGSALDTTGDANQVGTPVTTAPVVATIPAPVVTTATALPAPVTNTAVTAQVTSSAQTSSTSATTSAPLAHGLATSATGAIGPASPQVGQTTATTQTTYTLPNGKTIDIGTSGFGVTFRDAIAKRQTDHPIVLDGIHFDSGSSKPNAQSTEQINVVVGLLQANPDIRLLIRGHTDEVGSAKDNTELSLVRANEVGVALVQAGIDRKRLRIMGMGNSEPISIDNTDLARQRNRRIDALILK
jgi:outer membrane protein OmpA-like peptidoglycan-associated protein